MTKNIFRKIALLAGVALMGVGCQTDYFNENYLPGYDNNGDITNVQEMEITLSEDDYAAIAKNSANKAIAEAAGEEAVAALSAISKNKYFASQDEAATYIPGWLAASYPTYDNGSLALITYTMALDIPADVQAMNSATEYTLTEDDYKTIWGSEEEYAAALTPKTVNKLRTVIPIADDAREGEYVVVTYNYSAEEPATEEPETPENPDQPEGPKYSSVLGSAVLDDAVEVKGYVSALSTQGPIITDATGSILLFKGADLAIGDEVTVSGTISAYNKGFQIAASSATVEKTGTTSVTYPTPVELDGAAMEALLTSRTDNDYAQFVKFTGTPSVGNYINIIMEGTEAAQGSIYGATDEVKAMFTDGEKATIYGYFVSISSGKYINVVVVSVDEEPAIGGGEETNSYSSVLGSAVLGDFVEVNGYISAVSTQGPILTDNGGSLLLFKTSGYEVGDVVSVSGTISSYGKGFQIGTADITIEKRGTTTVTYPAPMEITGAMADELLTTRVNDEYAYYAKMTGTVAINGNYYNFILPGATTAQGSFYGATDELKAQLTDGMECTIYGYFTSLSGGKYINMVVTSIETAPAATALALKVKSEKRYAYFKFNGTAYEATDIVAVQPSDYTSMGQGYGNFTNPTQDNYLPQFLAQKYPYAAMLVVLHRGRLMSMYSMASGQRQSTLLIRPTSSVR